MFIKTMTNSFPHRIAGRSEKDIDISMYGDLLTIRRRRETRVSAAESHDPTGVSV
jgi:hypothetical protein